MNTPISTPRTPWLFFALFVFGALLFLFEQLTRSPPDFYCGVPPVLTTLFARALVSAVLTFPVWRGASGASGGASTTVWRRRPR